MKFFIKKACIVVVSLVMLVSSQVYAFGLGKIELSSFLNEPLKAEIPVVALSEGEMENLTVTLASNEEFERAGLTRSFLLSQFTFEVVKVDDQVKILVRSEQSVKEPFLGFLVSATTGDGRLIREYALLLDPPKNVFVREPTQIAVDSAPEPRLVEAQPTARTDEIPPTTDIEERLVEVEPARDNYRVIEKGDTLWQIALETRPDRSVSPQQMMMALLRQNPVAFINGNINLLRVDARLSVPDSDVINELSKQQAIAAVAEQNESWQNRGKQQALAEADDFSGTEIISAPEEGAGDDQIKPDILQEVITEEEEPRLTLEMPDDILQDGEIEEGDLSLMGDSDVDTLSEQLTLSQQAVEGQAQENIDFNAEMEATDEKIETLDSAISLEDNDLARMQEMLEEQGLDADLPADANLMEDDSANLVDDGTVSQDMGMEGAMDRDVPLAPSDDMTVADDLVPQSAPPVASSSASLITNTLMLATSAVLLIAVAWLLLWRRLKPSGGDGDDDFADLMDGRDGGGVNAATFAAADDYINKDDLSSAKRILEDAYKQDPSNTQVLRKLFFVLYSQESVKRFITVAEDINLNQASPLWSDVSDWGRQLAADHPLFQEGDQMGDIDDTATQEEQLSDDDALHEEEVAVTNDVSSGSDADIVSDEQAPEADSAEDANLNVDDEDEILSFEPSPISNVDDNEQAVPASEDVQLDAMDDDDEDEILSFEPSPISNVDDNEQAVPASEDVQLDAMDDDDEDEILSFEPSPISDNQGDEALPQADADIVSDEQAPEADSAEDANLNVDDEDEILSFEPSPISDVDDNEQAVPAPEGEGEDVAVTDTDDSQVDTVDENDSKLDLAKAYVDIGDTDGARVILEEIVRDGNDDQKTRAQSVLDLLS